MNRPTNLGLLFFHTFRYGGLLGAGLGAVYGTFIMPLFGTVFGFFFGAIQGLILGTAEGLFNVLLTWYTFPRMRKAMYRRVLIVSDSGFTFIAGLFVTTSLFHVRLDDWSSDRNQAAILLWVALPTLVATAAAGLAALRLGPWYIRAVSETYAAQHMVPESL